MHHHKNQLPDRHPINRRPLNAATERYRVRDKDWEHLWADNLSYDEAIKMRDQLIAAKRSKTARVESMSVEPPEWWVAANQAELPELDAQPDEPPREADPEGEVDPTPQRSARAPGAPVGGVDYQIDGATDAPIPIGKDGVIRRVATNHELMVNGVRRLVPTAVKKGDMVACTPMGPALAAAQAAAAAAVSKVIAAKRRPVPLDYTVKPSEPRRAPPPPDTTVKAQPQVVRLVAPTPAPARPLPSPLKVAMIPDGDPLGDDALTDSDLPDLATDLGGGPSDADLDHARRQAEAERARR